MRLVWRNGPEWPCFGGMGGEGWGSAGEDSTDHIVLRVQDEEGRESKCGRMGEQRCSMRAGGDGAGIS